MTSFLNVPAPHEWELKTDYMARVDKHAPTLRAYPSVARRHLLAERRWAKAKRESLVSVSTSKGEVLLFGRVN